MYVRTSITIGLWPLKSQPNGLGDGCNLGKKKKGRKPPRWPATDTAGNLSWSRDCELRSYLGILAIIYWIIDEFHRLINRGDSEPAKSKWWEQQFWVWASREDPLRIWAEAVEPMDPLKEHKMRYKAGRRAHGVNIKNQQYWRAHVSTSKKLQAPKHNYLH